MKMLKWSWLGVFAFVFVVIACQKDVGSPSEISAAKGGKSNTYDALQLFCAGNTLTSIDLEVKAGTSGAPSGFSVQWMTKAQHDIAGWPVNTSEPDPITQSSFCKGSFSGNANASRYNLGSNESVVVTIGSFLFDNGASTDCTDELECGEYVFRAFAHGDNKKNRSEWSADRTCATEGCDPTCTRYGFGYWKNNCDLITGSLTIGNPGIVYTPEQLCTLLNTPAVGNGLLILGHQVIAAKLNRLDTETADIAIGTSNLLTDTQPANWQATLIATLRRGNSSCTQ